MYADWEEKWVVGFPSGVMPISNWSKGLKLLGSYSSSEEESLDEQASDFSDLRCRKLSLSRNGIAWVISCP